MTAAACCLCILFYSTDFLSIQISISHRTIPYCTTKT